MTCIVQRRNPNLRRSTARGLIRPTKSSHSKKRSKASTRLCCEAVLVKALHVALVSLILPFIFGNSGCTIVSAATETSHSHNTILPDITGAIGSTPLVDLSRITRRYGVQDGRILGKCEYLSPGFSKKDRIAKQIILDALESGELQPGQPVVELTSGNTGTGLAIVCGVLGVPFCAVMSKGNSVERARMMKALGAQVALVDQVQGSTPGQVSGQDLEAVEQKAQELVDSMKAFRADQFVRESNLKAHLTGTGPEIWKQSGGAVTAFCDFVGTGGSFGGVAAFLRPKGVRCYVVEPTNAAILAGNRVVDSNHRIQGGGYIRADEDLPMLTSSHEDSMVDGYIQVSDEEAIQAARDLAKYEGSFVDFRQVPTLQRR